MRHYKSNITSRQTYLLSETYKKSQNGFDLRAYNGWDECFNKHVIPLVVKNETLQQQIVNLKLEIISLRKLAKQ